MFSFVVFLSIFFYRHDYPTTRIPAPLLHTPPPPMADESPKKTVKKAVKKVAKKPTAKVVRKVVRGSNPATPRDSASPDRTPPVTPRDAAAEESAKAALALLMGGAPAAAPEEEEEAKQINVKSFAADVDAVEVCHLSSLFFSSLPPPLARPFVLPSGCFPSLFFFVLLVVHLFVCNRRGRRRRRC